MTRLYNNNNKVPLLILSKKWYPEPDDWWRACDITGVADGGVITSNWISRGTTGTNAEPTGDVLYRAASADMNNLPAVEFQAASFFDCPYYTSEVGTVIVVAKLTAVDGAKIFISQGDTTVTTKFMALGVGFWINGYWQYNQRWADTADNIFSTVTIDTSKKCYIYRSDGSKIYGWINGVAIVDSVQSGGNNGDWWGDSDETANRLVIGGYVNGAAVDYVPVGLMSEMVIFNRHIDTSAILRFADNLMKTYDI